MMEWNQYTKNTGAGKIQDKTPLEKIGIKQPDPEDLTPEGMFKAFICEICSEQVYLPLCPNEKNDRFERLAWSLYMIKCNEKHSLCHLCLKVYNAEIKNPIVTKKSSSDFIKAEDKIDGKPKRKVKISDINKAIEWGLLDHGDCLRI